MKRRLSRSNHRCNKFVLFLLAALLLSVSANAVLLLKNPRVTQLLTDRADQKAYLSTLNKLSNHPVVSASSDTCNVLCIGNSITKHAKCDYWWSECGMAASSKDHDYVHLLQKWLEGEFANVSVNAVNFSDWERTYWDRFQTTAEINDFLAENLNLVILQLGDNIVDHSSLSEDLTELLKYIEEKCPNADIIVLGCFYFRPSIDLIKLNTCISLRINFVSLDAIQTDQYRRAKNDTVYDDEGNPHTISHSGTTMHPNDKAFEFIASEIINLIW